MKSERELEDVGKHPYMQAKKRNMVAARHWRFNPSLISPPYSGSRAVKSLATPFPNRSKSFSFSSSVRGLSSGMDSVRDSTPTKDAANGASPFLGRSSGKRLLRDDVESELAGR